MTENVEGQDLTGACVEIRVVLGARAFERLIYGTVPCTEVFLSPQPGDTFALGVVTSKTPDALGLTPRKVENDDRERRFGS